MGAAAASPFAWRIGALYWAKSSAWRNLSKLTPENRQALNTMPALIVLPPVNGDSDLFVSAEIGSYIAHFRRSDTLEQSENSLLITYPRFQARILPPFSTAQMNGLAAQLHFKNSFELRSAAMHARLDEIDRQPDLSSLERHLILLSQKMIIAGRPAIIEEFNDGNIAGFLRHGDVHDQRTIAEIELQQFQAACGVWFTDRGGMTMTDVKEFLAGLRFEPQKAALAASRSAAFSTSRDAVSPSP